MRSLIVALALALSLPAVAQYEGSSDTSAGYGSRFLPSGWTGYVEVNSGYTANNDNIAVEGVPSSIKLLGSYFTREGHGVFDLGVGAHNQTFIDQGAADDSITTTVMEVAARIQTENQWQFGPVFNQFFDRGENYGSNQADAMFGGLQLLKEMTIWDNSTSFRVGLRAMRDINTEGADVDMAMLDLAFGGAPRR